VDEDLRRENEALRRELEQTRQALAATMQGQIDAVAAVDGSPVLLRAAQDELRASRQLLRAVFDGIVDALLLVSDDGALADANPAACRLFGLTKSELLGRAIPQLEPRPGELAVAWQDIAAGGSVSGRIHIERTDHGRRLVDYCATLAIRPHLHLLALRDVTEQRAAEARFQAMIEKSQDGVSLLGADARSIYQSPAVERLFGWTAEEARTMVWQDFVPPEEHAKLASVLSRIVAEPGGTFEVDFRTRHRDGGSRWVELVATNLLHDPLVAAIVTNFRDITARKALESEKEGFFELTPDLLCIAGFDGRFKRVNPAWVQTLGWTDSELVTRLWLDLVHPQDRAATEREGVRLAQGLETIRFENRYRCRDGSYRWLQWSAKPVPDRQLIYATGRDITEQRASSERNRLLFAESPFPKFVMDGESRRFVDVNEAALQLYGYSREEFLAMRVDAVIAPEERADAHEKWAEVLATGEVRISGRHHLTREGARLDVDISSKRIALGGRPTILTVVRDMTVQRRLETQLSQAQKLESIGNLAGGVAHDFNNLMSIILTYTEMMLGELQPNDPFRSDLEEIKKAGERATELTRQLLAFSRQQILEPQPVDLAEVLAGMERMLRRLLREDIELTFIAPAALGVVLADPGQLEQVIVNLAVNARDAMPNGGRLTIEACNVDLDEGSDESYAAGRYVMLAVSDTGHGMDAATRARVFEPFFTTKPKGQGTGLGLSTVFGIVKQSGGHIWVYSEVGHGTTFKVYLPRTERPRRAPRSFLSQRGTSSGSETILLVEDEKQVRAAIRTILTRAGYEIFEACNGEEALRLVERLRDGPIHLLLTDVVMPGLGGRELAERVSALLPAIKVLYMSGYTDEAIVHHGVLEPGLSFYQKPVIPQPLLRKVRAVLDSSATATADER
jgi:two-component system, cell cycle sensor histidine kinase and response regulator CckA